MDQESMDRYLSTSLISKQKFRKSIRWTEKN